jgi:hypothetical protein
MNKLKRSSTKGHSNGDNVVESATVETNPTPQNNEEVVKKAKVKKTSTKERTTPTPKAKAVKTTVKASAKATTPVAKAVKTDTVKLSYYQRKKLEKQKEERKARRTGKPSKMEGQTLPRVIVISKPSTVKFGNLVVRISKKGVTTVVK